MSSSKSRAHVVVDTNVAKTANGANHSASPTCVAACAVALEGVMKTAVVYIDDGNGDSAIVGEYRRNLSASGQPGPGDVFLKWLLTNEWTPSRVQRVPLTPCENDEDDYVELPAPLPGVTYDRSDRKFLAVAAAHRRHPQILQALDSKWWGWRESLARAGVTIKFLCEEDIKSRHLEKMGPS